VCVDITRIAASKDFYGVRMKTFNVSYLLSCLWVVLCLEVGDKRHFVRITLFEPDDETVQLCPHETTDCEW